MTRFIISIITLFCCLSTLATTRQFTINNTTMDKAKIDFITQWNVKDLPGKVTVYSSKIVSFSTNTNQAILEMHVMISPDLNISFLDLVHNLDVCLVTVPLKNNTNPVFKDAVITPQGYGLFECALTDANTLTIRDGKGW